MSNRSRPSAAAWPGTLGVVLAMAALFLAIFPAGAGHGWVAPFLFSIPLFIIYPIALIRSRTGQGTGIVADVALVATAIVADIALCWSLIDYRTQWVRTVRESVVPGVDRSVFPIFLLWLLLWLFWQAVALRTLLRNMRARP